MAKYNDGKYSIADSKIPHSHPLAKRPVSFDVGKNDCLANRWVQGIEMPPHIFVGVVAKLVFFDKCALPRIGLTAFAVGIASQLEMVQL